MQRQTSSQETSNTPKMQFQTTDKQHSNKVDNNNTDHWSRVKWSEVNSFRKLFKRLTFSYWLRKFIYHRSRAAATTWAVTPKCKVKFTGSSFDVFHVNPWWREGKRLHHHKKKRNKENSVIKKTNEIIVIVKKIMLAAVVVMVMVLMLKQ